ncbi:virulence factor Mce family protein [Mycolicibacterium holsaticum]|uniref:Mammalian cell entry protein n=1 Tax=Mycolicibacterium holsaticum TaxID=152142 RepID=A0A1E3S151_9MYCO|nr:virulence factor Mce family protein [Mycolicibacterium holsaticum]MDA4110667.1 mammalian cell entry protein [Mycolicibacterium holsaticum DSM 44478 = JCM 12374]ODQ95781.1 mammalian cell entry protein [Mycolicibacterium holsaticum]QZA14256.1 virulence factor Mce family protein [Mycolicibacterium holsaticum DSM 44478 = JCM 12374]UNC08292.1 virulence factor Mce family protein [Mycolicibacterium holsaticum DSM 44478 = JCM 12374]
MTRARRWRTAGVAAALVLSTVLSGCGWRGLNALPLPGTQGRGPGSFTIQAQMPDVHNIQQNSRVRVGDVNVGTVTTIERQGWHALVTIRLNGDVNVPANATISVGQTSLLGSLHIELAPPTDTPPQGRLRQGSVIPLSSGRAYPSTEQTLAAASLLLNGGGIGQVHDITKALSTAFAGREDDLRSLLVQLDTFMDRANDQTSDIIAATESFNRLVGQFAAQQPVVDEALEAIPDGLAVLNSQRDNLVEVFDQLGKFNALAADSVHQTRAALVQELKDLGPVLESLANAGPALTRSLDLLTTYPFPKDTLTKWMRGDYANVTVVADLTLSRMDSALFTGTRWEGDLTELELQWGRTIGQLPSPYTASNPLMAPYRWDQGP